jgi:hypothetical protein
VFPHRALRPALQTASVAQMSRQVLGQHQRTVRQKALEADAAGDCRRQRKGPDGDLEVAARREENILKDVRESNTDIGAAPVERSSRASQGWGSVEPATRVSPLRSTQAGASDSDSGTDVQAGASDSTSAQCARSITPSLGRQKWRRATSRCSRSEGAVTLESREVCWPQTSPQDYKCVRPEESQETPPEAQSHERCK